MKKNKICFISIFSYPLFNKDYKNITFGGSEVQVFNYSKKLSEDKNYKISVIVGDFGQDKSTYFNNIKVIKSFSTKKTILNYIKAPFKLILDLIKINPDIIICRAIGYEVFFSTIYKLIFRKKIIYMGACDNDFNGIFFKGLLGILFKFSIKNSNFIICQNNFQKKSYSKTFNKNNLQILNNSFNLKTKNFSKEKDKILWVGSAQKLKKPNLFLKLVNKFPNEKFVMIMPKSSDLTYWNEISKEAKKLKNLKFIEKVSFNKIQEYFNKAKIFINTSDYEGFPNTFIQAGIGKTPILSLNVNPNNIFKKNRIGFFATGNFDLMIKQLKKLLDDKLLLKQFSQNSFEYILKNHDINKNINVLKKIIDYLYHDFFFNKYFHFFIIIFIYFFINNLFLISHF